MDPQGARAARDELKVGGVLVTTIERYLPGPPPRVGISMRLVSATDDPAILWIDGIGRSGDESPGLLGLGLESSVKKLEREVVSDLARSLARAVRDGGPRAPRCEAKRTFSPHVRYRAPRLSEVPSPRIAVLPFLNRARQASAGELMSLGVVRGLSAIDRFRVLEPGVVRDLALRFRLILEGGVTVQQARTMLGALEVDVVVTGEVFEYVDGGSAGATRAHFSITAMDGRTGKVVWQSASYSSGDEARTVFDFGEVTSVQELRCLMVRNVVDGMVRRPRSSEVGASATPDGNSRVRAEPCASRLTRRNSCASGAVAPAQALVFSGCFWCRPPRSRARGLHRPGPRESVHLDAAGALSRGPRGSK